MPEFFSDPFPRAPPPSAACAAALSGEVFPPGSDVAAGDPPTRIAATTLCGLDHRSSASIRGTRPYCRTYSPNLAGASWSRGSSAIHELWMCECPIHFTRYSTAGAALTASPRIAAFVRAPKITSTCFPDSKIWSTTPFPLPPPPSALTATATLGAPRLPKSSAMRSTLGTAPPARKIERCVLCISVGFRFSITVGFAFEGGGMRGNGKPPPRCTGAGALNASPAGVAAAAPFFFPTPPLPPFASLFFPVLCLFVSRSESRVYGLLVASLASSGAPGMPIPLREMFRGSTAEEFFGAFASAFRVDDFPARFPPVSAFFSAAAVVAAARLALVFSASFSRFASTFVCRPTSRTAARTSALASSAWSVFLGKS